MTEKEMAIFESVSQKQMTKEYQEHLELLKMQQEMEYQKMSAQMAMNSSPGILGGYGQQAKVLRDRHRLDPNKREAFQIPLSQLVTMWQVKHGDQWVDGSQPMQEGEEFYADAYMRLAQNELFERVDGWARLKENVENLLANR